MPISSGLQDVVDTITLSNLSNLTAPIPTLVIPAGLADLYISTIKNNVRNDIGLAPDIQELVKTLIVNDNVLIITV
ncbi:hypothetical protein SDC9_22978 [bioreactor metagenome]|uniref:Uncharacterized protein n=1 Tax=bioreactor metagenome TaxID=1076179 RepID=A0A644UDW1_9ZZZZ